MKRSISFLTLLFIFTVSCAPPYLTVDELKNYILVSDHGLKKEVLIDDYKVRVTFRPTDLLIAQEVESLPHPTQVTRLRNKYGSHYYFVLSLSKSEREAIQAGVMPHEEFSELLQIISFRMGAYVNMTTARQDTIPLADFAYSRTFGMGASNDILLVFNKKKITDQQWVQINLAEFGLGLGRQSLRFNCKDLDGIPEIDFTTFNR
jgi:hypothetical protein